MSGDRAICLQEGFDERHDPEEPRRPCSPEGREGRYTTEAEVVADALRLMEARDRAAQIKRARLQDMRLQDMIDRGYEDVAAGKVIRLENDDQIDAFFADL